MHSISNKFIHSWEFYEVRLLKYFWKRIEITFEIWDYALTREITTCNFFLDSYHRK